MDEIPDVTSPANPKPIKAGPLAFQDLSFSYGGTEVLYDLSIEIAENQVTALVGPSGAGKSTLFGLLTRLQDPSKGRITIGGTDIAETDLVSLRNLFAVVGQEAALFDETVAENIRFGNLDASMADVSEAADAASVSDFAKDLENGLETRVGPRGSALSGGQRQRVAIARAMLRDAPILLLDEPTSALDAQSEEVVQSAINRLSEGRTTLVIAHRLSTVRGADRILVLDKGRIVEDGTHSELIAAEGVYASLYRLQMSG
jgi:ABC-type multidrug transport system fused ATPase/permease subunit